MIGRARETAALEAAYLAAARGEPQLVLITGAPGIGRTTVLEALASSAEAQGAAVVRVRCFPVGQLAAFGTLGSLVSALLGIPDTAPPGEIWRVLRLKVSPFPDPDRYLALLGRLFALDVPHWGVSSLQPVALAQALFAAIDDVLRAEVATRPFVLAIDDAHWSDQGSIAWIESIGARLVRRDMPLLVACTALEASLEFPAAPSFVPVTRLALDPLGMTAAVEIASQWLDVKVTALSPTVRTVVNRVLDRAGGNPGYLLAGGQAFRRARAMNRPGSGHCAASARSR